MDRVSSRLQAHLHSVFSADPAPVLALRVRHAAGASWAIAGTILTVTANDVATVFDLPDYTLAELATALVAAGYSIEYQNTDVDHLAAMTLLEGAGHEAVSNGDHLNIFTSMLAVIQAALGEVLGEGEAAIPLALGQLILPAAVDEWADVHGGIYGIRRLTAENDGAYTQRILAEVARNRANPAAMIRNVLRLTGETITLREPWREIFTLSRSRLSGGHHLQGAPIYQYHTLQPVSDHGLNWAPILAEIQADRPTGTLLLGAATHFPPADLVAIGGLLLAIHPGHEEERTWLATWNTYPWEGDWDDRQWSAQPTAFPIGPPYDES
jgi:hypothetical protein